jgi:hypothetical protein
MYHFIETPKKFVTQKKNTALSSSCTQIPAIWRTHSFPSMQKKIYNIFLLFDLKPDNKFIHFIDIFRSSSDFLDSNNAESKANTTTIKKSVDKILKSIFSNKNIDLYSFFFLSPCALDMLLFE